MTCFPSFCDSLSFSLFVRRMPSRYFWPKLQVQMQLPQWWSLWLQDWGLLLPPWLHRSWLQLKWVRKKLAAVWCFFETFFLKLLFLGCWSFHRRCFSWKIVSSHNWGNPWGLWKKDIHLLLFAFVFILLCEWGRVYFRRLSEWILREGLC